MRSVFQGDDNTGARHSGLDWVPTFSSLNGMSRSTWGSFGSPSTRSPMMLRCTSSVPPAMRAAGPRGRRGPSATRAVSSHAWPPAPAMAMPRSDVRRASRAPASLAMEPSGPWRLAGLHRGAGALPDVAHDLRADVDVGDALAHDGVRRARRAGGRARRAASRRRFVRRRHRSRWRRARSSASRSRSATRRRPRRSGSRPARARR